MVAVSEGFEHLAAGAAALDFLGVGEQTVKAADQVVHLINGMEGTGKTGKGQVAVIMKLFICQQGLMRP